MHKSTRAAAGLLLTAAILAAQPAAATPTSAARPAATPHATQQDATAGPPRPRTVTLVTGDRVTVNGELTAMIEPGEGREGVTFTTEQRGGRLRVLPSDAVALLSDKRLDPRLFDVTGLLELGYDDRNGGLPLIVAGAAAPRDLRGVAQVRPLAAVDGFAVRQERAGAVQFWKDVTGGKAKIWLDGRRRVSLGTSVKQIGAPAAWSRGLTGTGVKVAVLDTGIDDTHRDLAGKVAARADFTGTGDARDTVGHGTHVASTIAGSGDASDGRRRGVAPGATLLDAKVCASAFCTESAILAGMQWAVEQGARVANLSLGAPDTPEDDPLEQAVQTLTEQYGILFVVAAGNAGADRSVDSPASADAALAVGAVSKTEEAAAFSSRGPRVGDSGLKPDITAPGVEIAAARSKDSPGEGPYVTSSGTSMATPHVAGVAALLAGARPGWTAGTLKGALMASAKPNPELGIYTQGAGRVDADRATVQGVTTEPAGIGFPRQVWPHGDDEPVTRKLVYRNHLGTPVTLNLEARAGKAFTVTPATLVVPAGGQAEATVTADTRADVPDGFLGGHVLATGAGGVSVSTPMAVEKEVESHDLTIVHTDRAGRPTGAYETVVHSLDGRSDLGGFLTGESTVTMRLPKGRYLVKAAIPGADGVASLIHPGVDLDRDRTVAADGRLARPISVKLPRADAVPLLGEVMYQWRNPDGSPGRVSSIGRGFDRIFTAQLGPDRTYGDVLTKVAGQWAAPESPSPYAYRLTWFVRGRVATGFQREVARKDLVAVRTDYASHLPDAEVSASSRAWPSDGKIFSYLAPTRFGTPFTQTEYLNTDDGIRWQRLMNEYGADGRLNQFESGFAHYGAGESIAERWNRGVFGPSLPAGDQDGGGAIRTGDVLRTNLWLHGDGRGSLGWSSRATERTALYREGKLIAETPSLNAEFAMPAGPGDYKLVAKAERGAPATLSTGSSVAWTFRSETPAGDEIVRLPLSVVTFTPELDQRNTAPAGRRFTVPVTVRAMPGSRSGRLRELSVEVSYDDGATWAKAGVKHAKVVLEHPRGDGFVSLRAKAADIAGNTVEQTVIRAYRIAG